MNIKSLIRNINLLNVVLFGFIILLVLYVFYPMFTHSVSFVLPSSLQKKAQISDLPDDRLTLSPADYFIIGDDNLFHPERRVPEAEKKAEKELPKPELFLYGTLITDDIQIAYVEDIKDPISTPGRGKRQTALRVGDTMGGYSVKEIHSDAVLLERGEDTIVLSVLDSEKPRTRATGITQPKVKESESAVRSSSRQNQKTTRNSSVSSRAPRIRRPSSNPEARPRPQARVYSNTQPISIPQNKPRDNVVPKSHTESIVFDFFDKQGGQ